MSARTEGFRFVRESRWVKEYMTPEGPFLDSKYRTFKCDASARDFIAAWKRADEAERADMEAAFRFYPLDPPDDVNLILGEVEAIDPERSRRMRAAWERNSRELTDDQVHFQLTLQEYLAEAGVGYELIGSNRWFRILSNDSMYEVETLVRNIKDMPSDQDLIDLENSASSPAYKHALRLVRGCKLILAPEDCFKQQRHESSGADADDVLT